MIKYEMNLDNQSILESILNNYIGRNKKLIKLIEILNSINDNKVISIDGNWGCGKTVFVKQLQLLGNSTYNDKLLSCNSINVNVLKNFQNKYIVNYYNAWEYDFYNYPLLSLIHNIIKVFPEYKSKIVNKKDGNPYSFNSFLKNISCELYDSKRIVSYQDIYENITKLEDNKIALNSLIDNIVPDDKKILLIIDELDRCKPSYAVELLEIIKHFFNNSKIVFIISTNNDELSHVINNYYGTNFDGYGYLNKFYDLIVTLNEIKPSYYLERVIKIGNFDYYYNYVVYCVCDYFHLTMRQINRLMSDFKFLEDFFNTSFGGIINNDIIVKYVFLPYTLTLRLINSKRLNDFINGNGVDELLDFVDNSYEIQGIIKNEYSNRNNENIDIKKILRDKYDTFFVYNDSNNVSLNILKNTFYDTLSLLGDNTIA